MSDTLSLSGPSVPPAAGGAPRQLVIFLHGVGADGNDLIGLAPYFQKALPHARFISPNAPYPFDMAPYGYQWFSLQDFTEEARLLGAERAAPVLNAFIDTELARDGLADENLALIGFSQGAMMSLHVGLRRPRPMAGIVSYSGWSGGNGHIIVIEHGHGFSTAYAHNKENFVKVGQTVKKGQQIAASGSTGMSTGPHLHYEVWKNGKQIDPLQFLKDG